MTEKVEKIIQEKSVPEYNVIEQRLSTLFRQIGAVTHPSLSGEKGEPREISRSLLTRAVRAELLKKLKSAPWKEVIAEARDRDEIARNFLNQREISINLPGLGEQKARYVVIEPSKSRETSDSKSKPTIFLIPGGANDIDPVGGLAQEIAFMGRRVVVVALPESTLGEITPEFAQSVTESKTYEPQVSFYKKAIRKIVGKEDVELWGFSAGAPIAAELLTDSEFQEEIPNAVLLSPAGITNQTRTQFFSGLVYEVLEMAKKYKSVAKYSLVLGRKTPDKPGQKELKWKVFKSIVKKVRRQSDFWSEARVRENGKIIVFSGGKDRLTKSALAEDELRKNPQIEVISEPQASHATPLVSPAGVLKKIFKAQEKR
jgi:pimeloyl-ACP methyl ester carboxylesterase